MKLPAECRTTAEPSQSIHGQLHPGFIDITSCESPWLCYCQILNTVHGSQEQKPASASSPDLLLQGQRKCALLLHSLAKAELAARKGGAGCTQSLCSRGESGTETQEQHKPSQFYHRTLPAAITSPLLLPRGLWIPISPSKVVFP